MDNPARQMARATTETSAFKGSGKRTLCTLSNLTDQVLVLNILPSHEAVQCRPLRSVEH